jgi:hypothetical protein
MVVPVDRPSWTGLPPAEAAFMSELDAAALEVARKVVEDTLIAFREARISQVGRGNGFVIREADGTDSYMIRLGTDQGLAIGIKAYLEATVTK